MSLSKLTKYCACHEKWISWLILVTHETLFTMRGATSVTVQTHQMLRLPRKMNLIIDPLHTWNVIYNARSNKCHCPNSPNTAPATKNDRPESQRNLLKTDETSFPMRGRSEHDPSMIRECLATEVTFHAHHEHFVLKNTTFRAPAIIPNFTEYCACHEKWHLNFTKCCACHEKWISWLILVTHETLFTMRGATSVIVQTHQMLRLPRKMNLIIDPLHTWNVIYNARSKKCHCPNSPNTAPATKNDRPESQRNLLKTDETSFPMRGRSEHDPRMIREWNRQSATRLATEVTFHAHHEHFVLKNASFRAPAIIPNFTEYCACHEKWHLNFTKCCACHEKWISWLILVTHETLFTMRGATSVIVQTHQMLRLPRKMNLIIDPLHTWNVIYNARSKKCHSPNSPNTAPATKNDRPESQRNLLKTDETSFPMRGRSEHDPTMIRPWNRQSATRLATEVTFHAHHEHFVLKNTTFRAPAIIPNFTEYCACHEKWHSNFTKDCACHAKWLSWSILFTHETLFTMRGVTKVSLSNFTKYCACHEKWISWLILDTNETLFTMRGATCVIVQTHQVLRLPRKMTVQNLKEICWKRMKRHFQCAADSSMSMIREWSDHDPTMKPSVRNPPRNRGYLSRPARAFCIEKYNISRSGYHSKFHRILRLPRKVTLELHQILRLPRKVTLALHQLLHLPRKVTLELQQTKPLLDWAMTSQNYYLTDDTYYLTTPITWRHLLLDDITWRHPLLDDT